MESFSLEEVLHQSILIGNSLELTMLSVTWVDSFKSLLSFSEFLLDFTINTNVLIKIIDHIHLANHLYKFTLEKKPDDQHSGRDIKLDISKRDYPDELNLELKLGISKD